MKREPRNKNTQGASFISFDVDHQEEETYVRLQELMKHEACVYFDGVHIKAVTGKDREGSIYIQKPDDKNYARALTSIAQKHFSTASHGTACFHVRSDKQEQFEEERDKRFKTNGEPRYDL